MDINDRYLKKRLLLIHLLQFQNNNSVIYNKFRYVVNIVIIMLISSWSTI